MTCLETERLRLRRWTDEDRAPFAEMNADPQVMEFFPSTLGRDESDALVDRNDAHFEHEGFGLWAVEAEGRFAGFTGLHRLGPDMPLGPGVEIGWRLARWAWGKGYAREAARASLADGFGRIGLAEVLSFTTETNVRSRAVMEAVGMRRRADLDFDHPRTPGWWGMHHVVYSISPEGRLASPDMG